MNKEQKFTAEQIKSNIEEHILAISKEFREGFEFLKKYPKSVSIFGSSHLTSASSHYQDAKYLAKRIVEETGYSVITGGGPGIMEAINIGSKEANGQSVGLTINLPDRQETNIGVIDSVNFNYFFSRKAMLTFSAEVFIFFPGGFGTLDELFSVLTLLQTNKIPQVPLILMGKDFWNPFQEFINENMFKRHHTVSEEDMKLFVITDSKDDVIKVIKSSKISEWWKDID